MSKDTPRGMETSIQDRKDSMKVPTYATKTEGQKPIGDGASGTSTYKPSSISGPDAIPRVGG